MEPCPPPTHSHSERLPTVPRSHPVCNISNTIKHIWYFHWRCRQVSGWVSWFITLNNIKMEIEVGPGDMVWRKIWIFIPAKCSKTKKWLKMFRPTFAKQKNGRPPPPSRLSLLRIFKNTGYASEPLMVSSRYVNKVLTQFLHRYDLLLLFVDICMMFADSC